MKVVIFLKDILVYQQELLYPMGKLYEVITPAIEEWIVQQKLFFVATAPLNGEGHINCSPKGLDSFRILDGVTVVYRDLTGSGAETIAHIRENGRIVIMFCAFEGPPKIYRLYGRGEVVLPGSEKFNELNEFYEPAKGVRSFIMVHVNRITDSCGYGVPLYSYQGNRDIIEKWSEAKGDAGIQDYWNEKNKISIDGLPSID